MNASDIDRICAWVVGRGLAGATEIELLDGFCERCRAAGLALSRSLALIDTLHPVYEGRGFRWRADGNEDQREFEYRPTNQGGENAVSWQKSAFFHLWHSGDDELRRNMGKRAREVAVERFDDHKIVPLYREMYTRVLG